VPHTNLCFFVNLTRNDLSVVPCATNLCDNYCCCVTYLQPFRQSTGRVLLSEIQDTASIEMLTVRQLKDILAYNFVDYKGCCEKAELVMRVRQLWLDHQRNVSYGE